jgi:hypothetical protein
MAKTTLFLVLAFVCVVGTLVSAKPEAKRDSSIQCMLCSSIVQVVEQDLQNGTSEQQIISQLNQWCSNMGFLAQMVSIPFISLFVLINFLVRCLCRYLCYPNHQPTCESQPTNRCLRKYWFVQE